MNKVAKIFGWGLFSLASLIALGAIGYVWYLGQQSNRNLALLGDAAPILKHGDYRYRDLNKNGELDPYEDTRLTVNERTENLLGQMTLLEKTGTMFIDVIAVDPEGELAESPYFGDMFSFIALQNSEFLAVKKMNHFNVVRMHDPKAMAKWQNTIQKTAERTRLGIPVTLATDPRHGFGGNPITNMPAEDFSLWPETLGLAATRDPALVEEFGQMAAQEYLSVGFRLALHPMADLATEPRWARASGTFGEDAHLSATMTAAYIRGFQGRVLGQSSVATMVKHFSGAGPQKDGEDAHFGYGKEQVYPGNQFDYHLIPFEQGAFPAGTAQVMPYYGIPVGQTTEDVGFAFNKAIITDMLRGRFGFDGVVCSDWGLISDIKIFSKVIKPASAWGVEHLTPEERMTKLIEAGIDQFGGERIPEMLVALVDTGQISQSRLDVSVRRLLRDKFRLGLFDDPYVDVSKAAEIAGNESFMAAGKIAQRKSLVLLKNGNEGKNVLPLSGRLKIYLENVDPEIAVKFGDVVSDPTQADIAIIRLHAPYYPHEGVLNNFFHSGDLDFKGEEKARILKLLKTLPTIVDIYLDRAAVIPDITKNSAALVANFGATDEVLLEMIWGEFSPTGKLPFELPSSMIAVQAQKEDVPYDSASPLFAFDFGLSYANRELIH